jgi:hypothetical protein
MFFVEVSSPPFRSREQYVHDRGQVSDGWRK